MEASGYVARRDGRFDDAIVAFERALAIDPQAVDVIIRWSRRCRSRAATSMALQAMAERARRLGADIAGREIWIEEARGDLEGAWAEVDGPLSNFISLPARNGRDQ
jgi:tetratricopeptide (TPR) repeat protein